MDDSVHNCFCWTASMWSRGIHVDCWLYSFLCVSAVINGKGPCSTRTVQLSTCSAANAETGCATLGAAGHLINDVMSLK